MGLKSYLQSRRDDAELGKGIWRRSHDRFIRGDFLVGNACRTADFPYAFREKPGSGRSVKNWFPQ